MKHIRKTTTLLLVTTLVLIFSSELNSLVINGIESPVNIKLIKYITAQSVLLFIAALIIKITKLPKESVFCGDKSKRELLFNLFTAIPLLLLCVGLSMATIHIATFISPDYILEAMNKTSNLPEQVGARPLHYVLSFISLVILTPLVEEFLFRGVLYRFMYKKYSFTVSLIVSSFACSIIHWRDPITAFAFGAFMVVTYEWTKKLKTTITIHSIVNLITFISLSYGSTNSYGSLTELQELNRWGYKLTGLLAVWFVFYFLVNWPTKKNNEVNNAISM